MPRAEPFSFAPQSASSPFAGPSSPKPSHPSKQPKASSSSQPSQQQTTTNGHGPAHDVDMNGGSGEEEDEGLEMLYLQPGAFPQGGRGKWKEQGRGILAAVSPVGGELVSWISRPSSGDPDKPPQPSSSTHIPLPERTLYFTSPATLSLPLVNFYLETHTYFNTLQFILSQEDRRKPADSVAGVWGKDGKLVSPDQLLGPPSPEIIAQMRRIVDLYIEEVKDLRDSEEVEAEEKARMDSVYYILFLAEVLYLPSDGRGQGLLGEELLNWVNQVDPGPNNSLGNEIIQTTKPWEHDSFWPYIIQSLLRGHLLPAASFIRTLSKHPQSSVSRLATLLSTHLTLCPRSTDTAAFPLDHQYLHAHRTWLSRFRAELATTTGGQGKSGKLLGEGSGDWTRFESEFRTVVDLMEGREEAVLAEAGSWREAVGAWGLLVDVGLRRDDLPSVTRKILEKLPAETTIIDDTIQSSLCLGDILPALIGCHDLDLWLAAHLGDVFDKLAMVPDDEERFELPLRDYFLIEYVDHLQSYPYNGATTLWRTICGYLSASGPEGRNRLREHILHVSLRVGEGSGNQGPDQGNEMDVEGDGEKADDQYAHFSAIREVCEEMGLEEEWQTISRMIAELLIRRGDYGVASTMCVQGGDGQALSRISEEILDAFIRQGEDEFLRLVDTMPPTLLSEAPFALKSLELDSDGMALSIDDPTQTILSIFASRLTFLSELRDYILFLKQRTAETRALAAGRLVNLLTSGVAPAGFWAVLLVESIGLAEDTDILFNSNDTFELLRVLEDVAVNSTFAPTDYLKQLVQYLERKARVTTDGNEKESRMGQVVDYTVALRKLEEVRLALARNLARALVVGFDNPF